MVTTDQQTTQLWELIKEVPDPEIPVLTLFDLGIVREIEMVDDHVEVTITPTYTGCPAMKTFEDDIKAKLNDNGYHLVTVKTVLSPAWSTDWMTEEGKDKLMKYGISPAQGSADKSDLTEVAKNVQCPLCSATNTRMISQFGSTPCKSLYQCEECKEPFDYFKCI